MAGALAEVGMSVEGLLGRGDDLADAARGVDILIIATPDSVLSEVAASVGPQATTLVAHLSGALGLDVLGTHERRASIHPLVPLPDPEIGRSRLLSGATFVVSGDPAAGEIPRVLGGKVLSVGEADRVRYHAAACMAANHLVALMGQVERVASTVGLPLDAFIGLARASLDDVEALGPVAALTGPVVRGDGATVEAHRRSLPSSELAGYDAGVALARRLALSACLTPEGSRCA